MSADRVQAFDFSANLTRALLWQYNEAPALQALVQQKNAWYQTNQTQFWQNWVRDVFDLRTCNDFGLEVWSIILGIAVQDPVPTSAAVHTWGFGSFNRNFAHGNFSPTTHAVTFLTSEQKRFLLQLRYYQLTSRCTIPAINRMLKSVLGPRGVAYVLDGGNMSMTYVFTLPAGSGLDVVLKNYDVLPRPAAVGVKYLTRTRSFGFSTKNQNFNRGTFLS